MGRPCWPNKAGEGEKCQEFQAFSSPQKGISGASYYYGAIIENQLCMSRSCWRAKWKLAAEAAAAAQRQRLFDFVFFSEVEALVVTKSESRPSLNSWKAVAFRAFLREVLKIPPNWLPFFPVSQNLVFTITVIFKKVGVRYSDTSVSEKVMQK